MDRWTLVAYRINNHFGLQLEGSGWGAGAKTLCTAALSLIYSTAECCASAWCRSAHTRLTDNVINDALRIVFGCLRPTPTDNFSVLSGIQPAKLCRQGVTLSLANRSSLDPGHILHGQLTEPQAASKEKLKSRHPFVSAARKLLHNFFLCLFIFILHSRESELYRYVLDGTSALAWELLFFEVSGPPVFHIKAEASH